MLPSDRLPVRLLLVDDHQVLRVGLRTLFESEAAITVVGEAESLKEGIERSLALRPDVVLMDLRLPDGHGVEGCREIRSRCPDIRVLFLTSFVDDEAVFATIVAGAQGYLLKEVGSEVLIQSVLDVARGGSCLDPLLAERARARIDALSGPKGSKPSLSPQEQRILAHLAQGLTNKEIAAAMNLSEKTVRNYLTSVFNKLKVARRTEAVARYLQQQKPLSIHSQPAT